MSNDFREDELLFRGITDNPNMWNSSEQRYTSAVFLDSKGLSVDRQKHRRVNEALNTLFTNSPRFKAAASVKYSDCIEIDAIVYKRPLETNVFHCEIHKSASEPKLSKSQAKALAKRMKTHEKG